MLYCVRSYTRVLNASSKFVNCLCASIALPRGHRCYDMACRFQTQQRVPMFKGDAAHLVDLLVQACEQRRVSTHMPAEHELVPWTPDTSASPVVSELQPLELQRRSLPVQLDASKSTKRRQSGSPNFGKAVIRRSKNLSPACRFVSPAAHPNAAYACPALTASPKPSIIPMPSVLLSRAAERINKSCAGAAMQHLAMPFVRPVAA